MKINKNSKFFMRREEYDRVKKMDRKQFDRFCKEIYDIGISVGKKEAQKDRDSCGNDITNLYNALISVKGIGSRRAEEVISILKSYESDEGRKEQKSSERKGGEENAD